MRVLGIHLGHDSNICFVEDGKVKSVFEPERYYRSKSYKLHAYTLEPKDIISTYQVVNVEKLRESLEICFSIWGLNYDYVGVECGGKYKEFKNLQVILKELGVFCNNFELINHHLCHANGAFFTSKFKKALIFSYDGSGNDGKTILFHGEGNEVSYLKKFDLFLGSSYSNFGYILNVRPEINKLTSGKIMGLAGHGNVREEWIPIIKEHIINYSSRYQKNPSELSSYGKGFLFTSNNLEKIKELRPYIVPTPGWVHVILKLFGDFKRSRISRFKKVRGFYQLIEYKKGYIQLPNVNSQIAKDLMATFQKVWTDLVMEILEPYHEKYERLCLTGGCALNGITNYKILNKWGWKNVHLVPNPSDCGLSIGAALKLYWEKSGRTFEGYQQYFDPYVGMELFDKNQFPDYKEIEPHRVIQQEKYLFLLAELLYRGKIIGLIQGKCEIGPRALGNRSILCNPTIKNMKDVLNFKVKHREWYRPFAPVCTLEDANKYFSSNDEINYMSVICYTREEFQDLLSSITHVDGSARLQTITKDKNSFLYDLLKEFEKLSGVPILLNTSLNPKGEPILNYLEIALDMLKNTEMDYVAYQNTIFGKKDKLLIVDEILKKN